MSEKKKTRGKKDADKAPTWIMTFADLMTLLLCFFVLLLSFSELDQERFKILTGSLKNAFGVQRIEPVMVLPKGVDLLKKEFNDPSFIEEVLKDRLRSAIRRANMEGNLRVKEDEVSITVTIPDRILFDSGSAQLKKGALAVLNSFREVIKTVPHKVRVIGHTDNVPINTPQFPSNWELSSARASAVIRHLLSRDGLDANRLTAVGCADTVPVAPNDSPEDRRKNRRVELVFQKKLAISDMPQEKSPLGNNSLSKELLEPKFRGHNDWRLWPFLNEKR